MKILELNGHSPFLIFNQTSSREEEHAVDEKRTKTPETACMKGCLNIQSLFTLCCTKDKLLRVGEWELNAACISERKLYLFIYLVQKKKKERPRVRLPAKRTNSLPQDANQSMTSLALSQTRQRDERHSIEHTRQGLGIATHAHPRNFSRTNARTRHPDLTLAPAVCLLEAWNPAIWRLKPTSVCLPLMSDGNHSNCCRNGYRW